MRLSDILRYDAEALACGLVFVFTLAIFWFSPIHQLTDSNYSMLLSQSLLEHRSFTLDSYNIPRLPPEYHDHTWKNGHIHQIELIGDHLYYYMPPGSSVLSLPYVALLNLFGVSAVNADRTYNPEGEMAIETSLAALLMATLAVVFFFTSRLILPMAWSIVLALGGALGTQVWSTASRALWADTWGILLLGVVIYILLVREVRKRRINPVILATLLSWMYFARPTNSVPIIAITVYLSIFHRRLIWQFLATGALWLLGFVAYSWIHFRSLLPHYFMPGRLSFGSFLPAMAGNLVSPSRGLFVYVPALLFVAYILIRYWKYVCFRRLVYLSLSVIVGFLIIVSGFEPWWAGASFGPRYTAPLVPWFILLAIPGVDAMRAGCAAQRPGFRSSFRAQLALGGLLLVSSVSMSAIGAISNDAWMWNTIGDIDHDPGKVWDLKYPQFLAPFLKPPLPSQFPLAEGQIDLGSPEAARFLWYGWANPEPQLRWSDGRGAAIIFDLRDLEDTVCEIKLSPFLVPGKLSQQIIGIELNGETIKSLQLKENAASTCEMVLPARLLTHRNALKIDLPDATSPESLNMNNDSRRLAIAVYWIRFRPTRSKQDHL
jgi:hypothetical protein